MPDAMPFNNKEPDPPDSRRRRYTRSPMDERLVSLTPPKVRLLRYLAELRFLSLPQLARLCCLSERRDLSEKSARRHMRELFDSGLVDVLPITRAALAPLDAPNDSTLLFGSAPNVYAPTARGLDLLYQAGLIEKGWLNRGTPPYGPRNSLFLAHELQVRDARVWLEAAEVYPVVCTKCRVSLLANQDTLLPPVVPDAVAPGPRKAEGSREFRLCVDIPHCISLIVSASLGSQARLTFCEMAAIQASVNRFSAFGHSQFRANTHSANGTVFGVQVTATRLNGCEQSVLHWVDGLEAGIDLGSGVVPRRALPDAWFVCRLNGGSPHMVLVAMVEMDRGTERGDRRWHEKLEAYAVLFSGNQLQSVTGYTNARVLIFAPDDRRRDWISGFIERHAPLPLAQRFWTTTNQIFMRPDLAQRFWRLAGKHGLESLTPHSEMACSP